MANASGPGNGRDDGIAASVRYEVDVTVRETFTMVVEASSAADARRAVRDPARSLVESWAHSDRQITGIKAVRRERS